jgi:superfamily II DNA or RNA helicase
MNGIVYRPYQGLAIDSIWNEWNSGVRSTLCISCTGSGKSVITAGTVDRIPEDSRFLYVVHRAKLAEQAVKQFRKWTNKSVELEMKVHGKGRTHRGEAQIVVASIQSLQNRLKRYSQDEFDFLGTDESHRFAGNSWAEILKYFRPKHRIGYTATPNRHDGVELIGPGCEFDSIAFNMPVVDGIHEGWVVPFRWRVDRCRDVDVDAIEKNGHDLSPGSVERHMSRDPVVTYIVNKMINVAGGRQGIVFCAGVKQVYAMDAEFKRRGAKSVAITGDTPEVVEYWRDRDFKENRAQFIIGCEKFIEGYDHPGIEVIGMCALTMSQTRYLQMAGRGSRTIGEPIGETAEQRRQWVRDSEKSHCTIIDFVGNSKRHSLQFGVNVLGGSFSPEEMEEAIRLVADQNKEFEIPTIVATAKKNIAERPKATSGGVFNFKDTAAEKAFCYNHYADPFTILELDPKAPQREVPEEETYGRPFQAAREYLVDSKLTEREIMELCQYSVVYLRDVLKKRSDEGFCTYPQARKLYNFGYDPANMKYHEARRKLIECKEADWLRPVQDGPNERFLNR